MQGKSDKPSQEIVSLRRRTIYSMVLRLWYYYSQISKIKVLEIGWDGHTYLENNNFIKIHNKT